MKIKGQLQWTDYLNAQLLHMQPNGLRKFFLYVAYSFFALIFATTIYLFLTGEFGRDEIYLVPLILLAIFSPFIYRKMIMPNQVKKSFAQLKPLSLPFEIEFTDTGVHISNELGNSNLPWTYFVKWNENDDIINLYQSDTILHMIPKRCFADAQQLEMLKSLLEKNKVTKVKSRFGRKETG